MLEKLWSYEKKSNCCGWAEGINELRLFESFKEIQKCEPNQPISSRSSTGCLSIFICRLLLSSTNRLKRFEGISFSHRAGFFRFWDFPPQPLRRRASGGKRKKNTSEGNILHQQRFCCRFSHSPEHGWVERSANGFNNLFDDEKWDDLWWSEKKKKFYDVVAPFDRPDHRLSLAIKVSRVSQSLKVNL